MIFRGGHLPPTSPRELPALTFKLCIAYTFRTALVTGQRVPGHLGMKLGGGILGAFLAKHAQKCPRQCLFKICYLRLPRDFDIGQIHASCPCPHVGVAHSGNGHCRYFLAGNF